MVVQPWSQSEFRVLGFHVGAQDYELHTTAAWKAFWSFGGVLIAKLALSARWLRRKANLAPVLALGAWSWNWSHDVWGSINTTTVRIRHSMVGIPRQRGAPWSVWHMQSWRSCQAWVLLTEAGPWGTHVLYQATKRWAWTPAAHSPERCTSRRSGIVSRCANCMAERVSAAFACVSAGATSNILSTCGPHGFVFPVVLLPQLDGNTMT